MEEKPNFGKAIGMAALVGGCLGLLGHILVVLFSFTPLYLQGQSIFLVLGTLGIIGAILFVTGTYPKLEAIGGMGAVLPFCGLSAAVAGATFGVGKATGSGKKGAMVAIIELLVKVVLVGTALCCVIAVVVFFSGFGAIFTAPYAPGGIVVTQVGPPNGSADGPPMGIPVSVDFLAFVWSFITVAVLSAITQAILMLTKVPMSVYLVILFVLSGICTPFGLIKGLVSVTGGGFMVLIAGAGEAIVSTFYAFLQGNFLPFLLVLCLFVFLFAIGIGAGLIKLSMTKGQGGPAQGPEGGPAEAPAQE